MNRWVEHELSNVFFESLRLPTGEAARRVIAPSVSPGQKRNGPIALLIGCITLPPQYRLSQKILEAMPRTAALVRGAARTYGFAERTRGTPRKGASATPFHNDPEEPNTTEYT